MLSFTLAHTDGCDLDRPGIYEWRIAESEAYVGQSKRLRSRLREYPNNVRKLLTGQPYRRGRPSSFRFIHHELAKAQAEGRAITFTVLENCAVEDLNHRERYWIAKRGTLNRR